MYEKLHDQGGLAEAQAGLGAVALAKGDCLQAKRHLRDALIISYEIPYFGLMFTVLNHIANLYIEIKRFDDCYEILAVVCNHPASNSEAIARAKHLFQKISSKIEGQITDPCEFEIGFVVSRLIEQLAEPLQQPLPLYEQFEEPLTERELEVLYLLAEGLSNQEIANRLVIGVGTIKSHNHSIYSKLGVQNRTGAVARLHELNMLYPQYNP